MNKKITAGLAVGATLILLLAVLYYLSTGTAPKTGPSPVTAPAAPTAPACRHHSHRPTPRSSPRSRH